MNVILNKLGLALMIVGILMIFLVVYVLIYNYLHPENYIKISPFYSIIAAVFILAGWQLKKIKLD